MSTFDTDFAFGIEYVDENELESVQYQALVVDQTEKTLEDVQAKLDRLYSAIQPLLNNLKANTEKESIKWPDRSAKVEEFSDHIDSIYNAT